MSNVIVCPGCGAKNIDTTIRCIYCGSILPVKEKTRTERILDAATEKVTSNLKNEASKEEKKEIKSPRSRLGAGLLNILLPFGIGRFYAGYNTKGILQLLTSFLCGIGAIWSFIDGIIMLATNDYPDANGLPMKI